MEDGRKGSCCRTSIEVIIRCGVSPKIPYLVAFPQCYQYQLQIYSVSDWQEGDQSPGLEERVVVFVMDEEID